MIVVERANDKLLGAIAFLAIAQGLPNTMKSLQMTAKAENSLVKHARLENLKQAETSCNMLTATAVL